MKKQIENLPKYNKIKKESNFLTIILFLIIGLIILESGLQLTNYILNSIQKTVNSNNYDPSEYRILVLGDSMSEKTKTSWPEQLQTKLNNLSLEKQIYIVNKAKASVNSALIMSHTEEYIETYSPNMIITMMGWNDFVSYIYYQKSDHIFISFLKNLKTVKLIRLINSYFNKLSYKTLNPSIYVSKFQSCNNFETNNLKFKKLKNDLKNNPYNTTTLLNLGFISKNLENPNCSIYYYSNALRLNSNLYLAWLHTAENFDELNLTNESIFILENLVYKKNLYMEDEEIKDKIYFNLMMYYQKLGESKKIKQLTKKIDLVQISNKKEITTKYHYQELYALANKKNITLVVMQYPTIDITNLKGFFNKTQQNNIIFIENKANFKNALKEFNYDKLFIDKFGESFGHCTEIGYELIADNVLNNIINILNQTTLSKK